MNALLRTMIAALALTFFGGCVVRARPVVPVRSHGHHHKHVHFHGCGHPGYVVVKVR